MKIHGYYGAKNVGDDAFRIVLAREFPHATFGSISDAADLVVGGGEYDTWMTASAPASARLYGIGIGLSRDEVGADRASVLATFRYLSVRTLASLRLARTWSLPATLGADLAYLLSPLKSEFAIHVRGRSVLVLPPGMLPSASGMSPEHAVVVPFHPSCDPGVDTGYDVYRCFDDAPAGWYQPPVRGSDRPACVLDILRHANHVFVWGTLHACVLAEQAGVPWTNYGMNPKITAHAEMCRTFSLADRRLLARQAVEGLRAALRESEAARAL